MGRGRRSRRSHWAGATVACVLATGLLAGCGFSNLAFRVDNRLHFVSPRARALVRLPVTIRWTMSKMSGSDSFAVFVDRAPVQPGQSLSAVADKSCRSTPGCVSTGYLANRGVYATLEDQVTIRQVNVDTSQSTQTHEATVVLVDRSGRRVGESAWYIDFRMHNPR